jgi:hypothetical protein
MTGQSSYRRPVGEDIDMAEGSPGSQELFEPSLKRITTTMPIITLDDSDTVEMEEFRAERMMHLPAEGADSGDLQDAGFDSGQPDTAASESASQGAKHE